MKGRPIDQLVYEFMFRAPKPSDPQNFHALLTRHLIYEVRSEVQSFYGTLQTQEHKYPGLDYCHPTHRIRLSRWQWHRRLFRAFDGLRLTPAEIAGLTKWEGTKWAKERFEKEQGIVVRDTAADDIPPWVEPENRASSRAEAAARSAPIRPGGPDEDMTAEESDDELQSIGVELNERLRERVAAHNAGDTSLPLDEDWEQWLKNAIETGEYTLVTEEIARLTASGNHMAPEEIFPSRLLDAARDGNWHEVPPFLHEALRQSMERNRQGRAAAPAPAPAPGRSGPERAVPPSYWRRTHSDLRLPVAEGATESNSVDSQLERFEERLIQQATGAALGG